MVLLYTAGLLLLNFWPARRLLKMGSRDKRHREAKKPKKTSKKAAPSTILPTPSNVEVIEKKGDKE
jgi:hypothetical protein